MCELRRPVYIRATLYIYICEGTLIPSPLVPECRISSLHALWSPRNPSERGLSHSHIPLAVVATKSALRLRLQLPVEVTLMVLCLINSGARGAFRRRNSKEIVAPTYQGISFLLDRVF
jgi:hypothetical protein